MAKRRTRRAHSAQTYRNLTDRPPEHGACYGCGNQTTGMGEIRYEDKSRKPCSIYLCPDCQKRAGGTVLMMVRFYKIAWGTEPC